MKRKNAGRYVTVSTIGETVKAYIPAPLPPVPLPELSGRRALLYAEAMRAVGALDAIGNQVPDIAPFIYTSVRREAVLSSMIEGTQSSLSDLLLYEQGSYLGTDTDDVALVSHYVAAMQLGMSRMAEGYPISLRLMRELHAELLRHGSGSAKMPGEFRQSQNWIGGTRPGNAVYVPPPPQELTDCLGALELFINEDETEALPALLKAALVHVQFESIHPFLDGNGRVGRLLIQMMLCRSGLLKKPLLYLSLYFKQHRQEYYRLLGSIREEGNWEAWIDYFLEAVGSTARQAISALTHLHGRMAQDKAWADSLGRTRSTALKLLAVLQSSIVARPLVLAEQAGISPATTYKLLDAMEQQGIVTRNSTAPRNRVYTYTPYADMLRDK